MLEITLDLRKTLEQNAAEYFERAKKAKRKVKRIAEILAKTQQQIAAEERKAAEAAVAAAVPKKVKRKSQWYEKYRWFFSSEGFLVIGGRDATTNEVIIKKHTAPDDLVFHTDMAGSPFFVVKADSQPGKEIGEATRREAANATCSFSRAWKSGMVTTRTFWVMPEQVSKQANPGEFMGKGAFMIRGKTNYLPASMDLVVGVSAEGATVCAPESAAKAHCPTTIRILQGNQKTSDVAKKLKALLKADDLDEVLRALPTGGIKLDPKIEKAMGKGR